MMIMGLARIDVVVIPGVTMVNYIESMGLLSIVVYRGYRGIDMESSIEQTDLPKCTTRLRWFGYKEEGTIELMGLLLYAYVETCIGVPMV